MYTLTFLIINYNHKYIRMKRNDFFSINVNRNVKTIKLWHNKKLKTEMRAQKYKIYT